MRFCKLITSDDKSAAICQSEGKYQQRGAGFRNFRYQAIEPRSSFATRFGVNHTTLTPEQQENFMHEADEQARKHEESFLSQMRARDQYFFPNFFSPKQQAIGQRHVFFSNYSPHEYALKLKENLSLTGSMVKIKDWMALYLTQAYIFDIASQGKQTHEVFVSGRPVCKYHIYETLLERNRKLLGNPEQFLFECVAVQAYMLHKFEKWNVPFVDWYREQVSRYFERRIAVTSGDMQELGQLDIDLLTKYNSVTAHGYRRGPSLYNFIVTYHLGAINAGGLFEQVDYVDQNHKQWMQRIGIFIDDVHKQALQCL
tara:strand:- start:4471 stop:5409 length:939 start_codon:yes stop_codon:yes gene_type:complete